MARLFLKMCRCSTVSRESCEMGSQNCLLLNPDWRLFTMVCSLYCTCKQNNKRRIGLCSCAHLALIYLHESQDPALNFPSSGSGSRQSSGSNPCYLSIFGNCKRNHLKFNRKEEPIYQLFASFYFMQQSYSTQSPEFKEK